MTENTRFIDNGNGTITDTQTQLMWKKNRLFPGHQKVEELVYRPRIHADREPGKTRRV